MDDNVIAGETDVLTEKLTARTRELTASANGFARAMNTAFARGITDGKRFDDTLKSLALRLSDLTVRAALRPVTNALGSGLNQLLGGVFGNSSSSVGPANPGAGLAAAMGAIKPFAAGGVIATPTYFPLR